MRNELRDTVQAAAQELFGIKAEPVLTRPDEQFGDFATNLALQLSKQLGKNPRDIAEALAVKLRGHEALLGVTVAGPGFLNLKLTDTTLLEYAQEPPARTLEGQVIVTEYSDPNPFKPLHAGHLYTTLVGDFISNLLEQAGAKVIRLNYGGDVGRHVAITMWAILHNESRSPDIEEMATEAWRGVQARAKHDPHAKAEFLGKMYALGTERFETDEAARQQIVEINKSIYRIHADDDRDSPFAHVYWACRQWSYDYFALLYRELKVHPFDRFIPESEVAQLGIETVNEQLEKGVYERSEGAVVFRGEHFGLHTRVFINSEGLPTYEAKDVGLIQIKWRDYRFDKSIVITASEQAEYYKVMLKSVEQFAPDIAERSVHLTHGVVKLAGGVKMSSRRGNVVTAMEILNAAERAAKSSGMPHNRDSILAAVKYAFARQRIGGDIVYDPAESVALEGSSGPYLQYAHARACSILAKAGQPGGSPRSALEPDERSLLRKISEYHEVVEQAAAELLPSHIASYLYELAQVFNRFYENNRVIADAREGVRLDLVRSYAMTLKHGLELLGIEAPERL